MGAILDGIRRAGILAGIFLLGGPLLVGTLLIGTGGVVRAQTLSSYLPTSVPGYATMPGVTVLTTARPDYQPPGVRVEDFLISPSFEEGVGYNSNVLGAPGSPGSWTLGTQPSVTARSDWSSDSVVGVLGIDDTRYLDAPRQSRTDATAVFGGTLAVGRDELTLAAGYLDLHEDRSAIDSLPSDTPIAYTVLDARAAYTFNLDRFALTPNLEISRYQYDNTTILGVPASQSYRDRDVLAGGVTGRYEIMPLQNLLVVLRGTQTNYFAPQAGQATRNSTGGLVLAGLSDDRDAVWRYRLLLGWEEREYAAGVYHAQGAPVAEGELIWVPSGETTVTAMLTRSIEDAAQEGVAGYTYTAASVTIDHEYARDILLQATGGVQQADFTQGGGRQTGLLLGFGVTWLIDRHMRLSATYGFNDQQGGSVGTSGPFSRSLGMLTLRYGW